jgi:hypothetical protein
MRVASFRAHAQWATRVLTKGHLWNGVDFKSGELYQFFGRLTFMTSFSVLGFVCSLHVGGPRVQGGHAVSALSETPWARLLSMLKKIKWCMLLKEEASGRIGIVVGMCHRVGG